MKNIVLLLLVLAVFTSCQKEYVVPDLVIESTGGNGLPVSYKQVASDEPGKAYITRFVYDAEKRVTQVISVEIDSTVTPIKKDTLMIERFLYTGAAVIPDKLVTTAQANPDTTYFQFDNTGKLIKDSTVSLGITVISHAITYTTTGFKVVTKEQGSPDFTDSIVISSDNLSFLRRSITGYPQYTQDVQLSFDAIDNPLYAQNIRSVRFHIDVTEIGWPFYSSKNAMKSYSQSGYQSAAFNVTNTVNTANKLTKQTVAQNNQILLQISYEY
jgi:hypothetical protein